jgi:hypothetical protein
MGDINKLTLKISCQYLAELIDISFEYFYITLNGVNLIELETFKNIHAFENFEKNAVVLTNPSEIFETEIDIYRAKINDGFLEINCWQVNEQSGYIANKLCLNCTSYIIYDHDYNIISIESLKNLSTKYWNNFK